MTSQRLTEAFKFTHINPKEEIIVATKPVVSELNVLHCGLLVGSNSEFPHLKTTKLSIYKLIN